jgi:hypothetical protein
MTELGREIATPPRDKTGLYWVSVALKGLSIAALALSFIIDFRQVPPRNGYQAVIDMDALFVTVGFSSLGALLALVALIVCRLDKRSWTLAMAIALISATKSLTLLPLLV